MYLAYSPVKLSWENHAYNGVVKLNEHFDTHTEQSSIAKMTNF